MSPDCLVTDARAHRAIEQERVWEREPARNNTARERLGNGGTTERL